MGDFDVQQYNYYKDRGAKLAAEGDIEQAIRATQKALNIHHSDKLVRRLDKMKVFLLSMKDAYPQNSENNNSNSNDDDDTDGLLVEICPGFRLHHQLVGVLYQYQREGISWMWKLHKLKKGGVLGDDMGLGKTIQIIAFLSGLMDAKLIRTVMIIMPVSLITNWDKEFEKWSPGLEVSTFHSETKSQREKKLAKVQRNGGILMTSYGMVTSNVDIFKRYKGVNFIWDYIILDEGHKIKNPTKTTKATHEISAKHRLVLTGTPIQNNLRELWALFDFVHQGTLLGSLPTFKMQYENPITRSNLNTYIILRINIPNKSLQSREKNASSREKILGSEMSESLRHQIAPYFLRRTKDEVMAKRESIGGTENGDSARSGSKNCFKKLPQKNDLILWLHLASRQIQIYDDFTNTEAVKMLLMTKKSPLVALTVLKKICDHPRLLSKRACLQLGMNGEISTEELEMMLEDESTAAPSIDVEDSILLEESGKLGVLIDLLEQLKSEGHRTLVFSQSRKMLDIINNILTHRGWMVMRLDGTINRLDDRQKIVNQFQNGGNKYPVMLLTTQVGGVGLTLTGADRVVIYDPSWNPATDSQAVDRAYRIGQTKPVVIYRLITCGTVEEKIYRRQIFKDSITRQTTGAEKDPHRYFTNMELKELFKLDDPRFSSTQQQLQSMHSHERLVYPELDEHLAHILSMDVFGISDHDLMFKGNIQDIEDDDDQTANTSIEKAYIRNQVENAKLKIQLESEEAHNEIVRTGAFNKDLANFGRVRRPLGRDLKMVIPKQEEEIPIIKNSPDSVTSDEDSEVEISDSELDPNDMVDLKNLSIVDSDFAEALEASMSLKSGASRNSIGRKSWDPKQSIEHFFPPMKCERSLNSRDSAVILVEDSNDEDDEDEDLKPPSISDLNQTVAANSKVYADKSSLPTIVSRKSFGNISVLNETDENKDKSASSNKTEFFSMCKSSSPIKHEINFKSENEFCSDTSVDNSFDSLHNEKSCGMEDYSGSDLLSVSALNGNKESDIPFKYNLVPYNDSKKASVILDSGDEDAIGSNNAQNQSVVKGCRPSLNSSDEDVARVRTFGKHRLLDTSEESIQDVPSPADSDSSGKRARLTPEGEESQLWEQEDSHAKQIDPTHLQLSSDEDNMHSRTKNSSCFSEDENSSSLLMESSSTKSFDNYSEDELKDELPDFLSTIRVKSSNTLSPDMF